MDKIYKLNEDGNIIGLKDKCDILSGDARESSEYNISCCKECYRFDTCINAVQGGDNKYGQNI